MSDFSTQIHSNPVEGKADLEGEAAGRRHGWRPARALGRKRKKGGRRRGPAAPGILSESRHAAWRD
jgi:hypothetical protein